MRGGPERHVSTASVRLDSQQRRLRWVPQAPQFNDVYQPLTNGPLDGLHHLIVTGLGKGLAGLLPCPGHQFRRIPRPDTFGRPTPYPVAASPVPAPSVGRQRPLPRTAAPRLPPLAAQSSAALPGGLRLKCVKTTLIISKKV